MAHWAAWVLDHGAFLRAFWAFLIVGVVGRGAVAWGREDRAPAAVWAAGWALLAVAAADLAVFGRR